MQSKTVSGKELFFTRRDNAVLFGSASLFSGHLTGVVMVAMGSHVCGNGEVLTGSQACIGFVREREIWLAGKELPKIAQKLCGRSAGRSSL